MHQDIELIQVISGTVHIITQSESYDLTQGEVAYFNPWQPHAWQSGQLEPCICLVLQFDPTFAEDYFPALRTIRFLTGHLSHIMPREQMEEVKTACYHIGYNYFGQKTGFEFRCMSDVNRVMDLILVYVPCEMVQAARLIQERDQEQRMARILSYIHVHYAEKLTLQEIADSEGLSPTYLSHLFKNQLGCTFLDYLNGLRFEHALMLLRQTDMKLLEICIECGFSDTRYMNRVFMEICGISPKELRKKQQSAAEIQGPVSGVAHGSSASVSSDIIYDMPESLAVLRANHDYLCDDGAHPNSI